MALKKGNIMATKKQTKARAATTAQAAAPGATATRRTIAVVVSDAQHDTADQQLASFDAVNGTAFAGGFTAWRPGWDSFDPPEPPTPVCWLQIYPFNNLAEAGLYVQAMTAMAGLGVRWYEALVIPDEAENPANTIDSIFASGYNVDGLNTDFIRKGQAAFLQKPYTHATLTNAVRECLDSPVVTE